MLRRFGAASRGSSLERTRGSSLERTTSRSSAGSSVHSGTPRSTASAESGTWVSSRSTDGGVGLAGPLPPIRRPGDLDEVDAVQDLSEMTGWTTRGGNVNAKGASGSGTTILMDAAAANNHQMVGLLLHRGARVDKSGGGSRR